MGRLHHQDFYGWTQDQADALRRRSVNEIDWDNLLQEILDLGGSTRRELRSRLTIIIQHLLKWRHQPDFRCRSWIATIVEQRAQITDLLEENPSLNQHFEEILPKAFRAAVSGAVAETGLPANLFETDGPVSFNQAMNAPLQIDA